MTPPARETAGLLSGAFGRVPNPSPVSCTERHLRPKPDPHEQTPVRRETVRSRSSHRAAQGGASPFVPTRRIEASLGIDAAADPDTFHAIWRILSIRIPRRTALSPARWPALPHRFHDQVPRRFCSLFLQFKTPVFQDSPRSKYHGRLGGPLFQVGITSHQQRALLQLQTKVRNRAAARYASPAFWSRADLDLHDEKRQVLVNSAFAAPSRVKKHRKWMYTGATGKALFNPEPEDADGEGWSGLIGELAELAEEEVSLRAHVLALAAAIQEREEWQAESASVSWIERLSPYGRFSSEDRHLRLALSVVAEAAEAADSTWLVLLLPNEEHRVWFDERQRHWRWGPPWWF